MIFRFRSRSIAMKFISVLCSFHCSIFLSCLLGAHLPKRSESAHILLMSPSLSPSLLMAMGRVADTLAETNRHNVTVWIPEMRPLTMTGTKLAHRVIRTDNVSDAFDMVLRTSPNPFDENAHSFHERIRQEDSLVQWCEALLQQKEELERLRAEHFDIVFFDLVDLCLVGIVHHLDIPRLAWVSTGPMPDAYNWIFGIPQPLSIVPTLQESVLLGPRMNVWERALNVWQFGLALLAQWRLFREENRAFRKQISPEFPCLEQIASRIDVAFIVGDEFIDPTLPTLAKVVNIGGLGMSKPPNALNPALLSAVLSAPRGAVLLTFGSNTDTAFFDQQKLSNLFTAFAEFADYAFIAKVSAVDTFSRNLTKNVPNIHLFEWVEQTDLLAHPSLRLFISHSGYNSMIESAIRGVPLLAIPLFFDQLRVAKSAEYRGFCRILTKSDLLSVERIKQEIGIMLNDPKYKANALRLSKLHREKPNPPEEQLIRWTEFLLENGPLTELVPESAEMGLAAYLCADIALIALGSVLGIFWLCRKALRAILARWEEENAVKNDQKKGPKGLIKRD
uniref:glucuronosyltransferase n=1 Tax=Globodera pallida TaxID=36090 RepID=A0A183C5N3_GLOPA